MRQYFDPHHYLKTITIVGLGGSGADTARIVGRILYDMKRNRQHIPDLVLVDPDRVEEKNVGRQLFAPSDVGQYKAEVASKRLNYALGLATSWIPEPVDARRHFDRYGSHMVISCVDNYLARRELSQITGLALSAGNHVNSGQVCIGNTGDPELVSRYLDEEKVRYLPHEHLLFPALLDPPPEPELEIDTRSCAERVQDGDQSLLVNGWMATITGQYVFKLLHRQPIYSFLTYINADEMAVRSVPVCRQELEVYL